VISPDGRHVAFVAHRVGDLNSVWVRSLDSLAARALPGTEGVPDSSTRLFWSPDSRSIGFFAGGRLKRVELTGGAPQVLADAPDGRGGTWSSRGIIVFTPTSAGALYSVPASGGEAKPLSKLAQSEGGHRWPVFLPDGLHFLFRSRGAPPYGTTEAASLDADAVKAVLTPQDTVLNVEYSTTGHLLFVRDHTLFARPFDVDRLRTTGVQTVIAEGVEGEPGSGAAFSISTNGVLVYRMTATLIVSRLRWVDRAGRAESDLDAEGTQDGLSLSTDGLRVALHRPGPSEVWVVGTAGGTPSRFTFDGGNYSPVWSPDGRQIAYSTQRLGKTSVQPTINAVYRRNSSGSGEQEQLAAGRFATMPTDWSPDGRFVIYTDQDPQTKSDLWAVPIEGERKPILLVRTEGEDTFGQVSPDGRWLSYVSTVTGREEVYLQEFPVARGKWQVSSGGGTQPRWRRDGKELFYVSADGQLTSVMITAGPDGVEVSRQNRLFPLRTVGEDYTYAVSPDGRRFLVNTIVRDSARPVVVVLNWPEDLKP
jgi:Tol biopolymer transport system component